MFESPPQVESPWGICTPRRSQIPDLNVSAHPALIVQSPPDETMANEQIAVGLLKLSC